ncbi:GIY-YIG nuclease family protein [uncultured Methanocorpusculum sp.]|nr:GIY-YIG nuclease family protein [uncultured Methanocorpusculum sp.]
MDKGIYCLILECAGPCTVKIGALGSIEFKKGWYLYAGSALGSGGLSRVSRYIRFFREQYRKPKWHIDYLMAADEITLTGVICAKTEERLECVLAKTIGGTCTTDFGCSDCSCASHLFYRTDPPETEVVRAFERTGLVPIFHLIR